MNPQWHAFRAGLWQKEIEEIAKIASFSAALGNVERVDVLPFHQLGRDKWKQLGMNYTLAHVEPPSPDLLERTVTIFRKAGLTAH
jgi:pyruvate formate lyase activating enzyme